ncbi:GntR family transcriptional regulator [Salipiger sp. CCB-MM3]|uniref:GntR family transcriptional regulator n=1 Tax=Salipiger sp. CCB-MM3 TaxID=1792508 RepID=UPI00080A9656|nr:GntR family transcriptional regulator [Salipiger sp. CCB-MM3]ANT62447.1 GntR family transcriptional regulator [Salipiger sp. CCB-MM3]
MDLSSASAMPLQIKKESLHDQVANRIRDLIIEGHLEPGSRIDEVQLLEQLGVSRTPFREALRTLAAEGLIVIQPSRGATVRKLSPQDVFSMLEVLGHLEKLAGQTACERASDEDIAGMRALHEEMLAHYRKRDRLPYYKLNQEFHSRLAALSDNETLQEIQQNIQGRLKRIRFVGNGTETFWADAVGEHEEMIAALEARDGARLGDVMSRHLTNTWDRVKETL